MLPVEPARRRPSSQDAGRRYTVVCAGPLVLDHGGADLGCRGGIGQRAGDQPQLHAEAVIAFLDHDDRLQRRQRRIRPRFEQAAPQRAQAADRIGAADIDAEFGAIDGELRRSLRGRSAAAFGVSRLVGGWLVGGRFVSSGVAAAISGAGAARRGCARRGSRRRWLAGGLGGAGSISLGPRGPAVPSSISRPISGTVAVVAGAFDGQARRPAGAVDRRRRGGGAAWRWPVRGVLASAACFPVTAAVVVATGPIRGADSVAAASGAGAAASAAGCGADAAVRRGGWRRGRCRGSGGSGRAASRCFAWRSRRSPNPGPVPGSTGANTSGRDRC